MDRDPLPATPPSALWRDAYPSFNSSRPLVARGRRGAGPQRGGSPRRSTSAGEDTRDRDMVMTEATMLTATAAVPTAGRLTRSGRRISASARDSTRSRPRRGRPGRRGATHSPQRLGGADRQTERCETYPRQQSRAHCRGRWSLEPPMSTYRQCHRGDELAIGAPTKNAARMVDSARWGPTTANGSSARIRGTRPSRSNSATRASPLCRTAFVGCRARSVPRTGSGTRDHAKMTSGPPRATKVPVPRLRPRRLSLQLLICTE